MIIGIDASNLLFGGGRTHLIELLSSAEPHLYDISKIIVWGRNSTLELLPLRSWLVKRALPVLEYGYLRRSLWQLFELPALARSEGISLLFSPGGHVGFRFQPTVTMSRNMLPFEIRELLRYGFSEKTLRLLILRYTQSRSFRSSTGVIFLTNYAQIKVQEVTGSLQGMTATIPHGVNSRFFGVPRAKRLMNRGTIKPLRLIYVSYIDVYKHQWNVVEAINCLRLEGYNLLLDLVGPSYSRAQHRLNLILNKFDPQRLWVHEHGSVAYDQIHALYKLADLGIFASSCENMPNILLETMASGLPIACSDRGPMPEILGEAGLYFDPENPLSIADCLRMLLDDPQVSANLAIASYQKAQQYTWTHCADQTLQFLSRVATKAKR